MIKKIVLFILVSALWYGSVSAQQIADSLELPEIVIVEKTLDRELRSTAPMQVLTSKTLANLNALQLSDAVKFLSGVTVKDYGGIGGLKTISVRSLGAAHTGINYNGVQISDTQTGQIDIGRFSLDNIDNITLVSGQSDQIFMPARAFASASALNITSFAPKFDRNNKTNGKASLKGGSFGLVNPAFNINNEISDKLSATLSGEWMSAHGRYPYSLHYGEAGVDSSSVEKRENSDVNNLRLEGALYGTFSPSTDANLRLYYYQSSRGLPGATIYYNTENYSKQRLWDRTFFAQGHVGHDFSSKWSMQANAKYNKGYLRYLDPTFLGSERKIEDIFNQQEMYGSVSVLYKAFRRLSFSASTDWSYASMTTNRDSFANPNRVTGQSVIATKWIHEYFLATASLLHTQTFEDTEQGEAAENQSKLSPYISLSAKPFLQHDLRLRAFYKNSFRLPTFNDLYYPAVGVRKLKPEDANQLNLGITYSTSVYNILPLIKLTADIYENRVKNKIIAYPTGNLHQWAMMNFGLVKIQGADFSAEGAINVTKKADVVIGATYTYQEAVDKTDSDKNTYNHQIPYTPKHSGSARAAVEMPWFNIAYSMLWSGERYYNAYNSNRYLLKGYTDHTLSVSKSWQTILGKIEANAEALNILNKNYQIVHNYPMPGRSYRITITLNF